MKKLYAVYLAVMAAVLATFAAWTFGITFAGVAASASSIAGLLVAFVSNEIVQISIFSSAVITATGYYGWLTFAYLFAGKKGLNARAGWLGFLGCAVVATILTVQGMQAQVYQEPQLTAQWHANLKLFFGVFLAFVGLATIGRRIFNPPPQPTPQVDDDYQPGELQDWQGWRPSPNGEDDR